MDGEGGCKPFWMSRVAADVIRRQVDLQEMAGTARTSTALMVIYVRIPENEEGSSANTLGP